MTGAFWFLLSSLCFSLFSPEVLAASNNQIYFSEIGWMGTGASSSDEWIELYNDSSTDLDLANWGIYEAGGATLVESLEGKIKAGQYYLLERTDDSTVSSVIASQPPGTWGGSGLSNTGEFLVIKNSSGEIVERLDCSEGWFAGSSSSKASMERHDFSKNTSDAWHSATSTGSKDANGGVILGTPGGENGSAGTVMAEDEEEEGVSSISQVSSDYSHSVRINEVLPNPVGSDDLEFVEIYNFGDSSVDLTEWYLGDAKDKKNIGNLLSSLQLRDKQYQVIYKNQGSVSLNNDGDTVFLYGPDGKVVSEVSYDGLKEGNALAFDGGSYEVTERLTPGEKNIIEVTVEEKTEGAPPETEEEDIDQVVEGIDGAVVGKSAVVSKTTGNASKATASGAQKVRGMVSLLTHGKSEGSVQGESTSVVAPEKDAKKTPWWQNLLRLGLVGGIGGMGFVLKKKGMI